MADADEVMQPEEFSTAGANLIEVSRRGNAQRIFAFLA